MNCCNDFGQCTSGTNCPARPATVAPIKFQRRTCDALGVCQGHPKACAGCTPAEQAATESDLAALNDMPADVWDRISFWGVVGIASVSTVAMVCGAAGWAYIQFIA